MAGLPAKPPGPQVPCRRAPRPPGGGSPGHLGPWEPAEMVDWMCRVAFPYPCFLKRQISASVRRRGRHLPAANHRSPARSEKLALTCWAVSSHVPISPKFQPERGIACLARGRHPTAVIQQIVLAGHGPLRLRRFVKRQTRISEASPEGDNPQPNSIGARRVRGACDRECGCIAAGSMPAAVRKEIVIRAGI